MYCLIDLHCKKTYSYCVHGVCFVSFLRSCSTRLFIKAEVLIHLDSRLLVTCGVV